MHSQRLLITGLMLLGAILVAGCGQNIVEDYRYTQLQKAEGYEPDPRAFDAELSFCRTVVKKTGERVGEGQVFAIGEKSKVRAYLDVRNQPLDELHAWHMVWLRPGDDKELFRKYAEVRVTEAEEGYEAEVIWKKAEDLTHFKTEIQAGDEPFFTLDTSYNVAPEKMRIPGAHKMRVYLNRELLIERDFELLESGLVLSGPEGPGTDFVIPKKGRVRAALTLGGLEPGKTYAGEMAWHKPGGKKMFAKEIEFTAAEDSTATLEASLDISKAKKRKTGKYQIKASVDGCLVARERFTLSKP